MKDGDLVYSYQNTANVREPVKPCQTRLYGLRFDYSYIMINTIIIAPNYVTMFCKTKYTLLITISNLSYQ